MVHPAGTVILTEASLGVEAVGRLGRTVGIVAGTTAGRIGATGTIEAYWGVEAVGREGITAGRTTAGRIEGITGTGAITFVLTLTK